MSATGFVVFKCDPHKGEIVRKSASPFSISIWIAGDLTLIKHYCAEYCLTGLCVTVTPTTFIYTGGQEEGARIGLINYPRFPANKQNILGRADGLARVLIEKLHQHSATIDTSEETIWLSRREQE